MSVIICAHNPRPDYLTRVIAALKKQTLSKRSWELLLVDNASLEVLERKWDLSWHPHALHLRENELGLTAARLLGIQKAKGSLLVFVDDDNVLAPDYLEQAMRLEGEWLTLGAWGGDVAGEFETPPQPWTGPYLGYLCIRQCKEARWSNNPQDWNAFPFGVGLCIRSKVARAYARRQAERLTVRVLDRKGTSLVSAGDVDMVLTCISLDLGFGRFPELRMTHLIPTRRLDESYIAELISAISYSDVLVSSLHGLEVARIDPIRDSVIGDLWRLIRHGRHCLRFHRARLDGIRAGLRVVNGPGKSRHCVAND